LQQQATIFFKFLKDFKTNEHITFFEFKNLHLDEGTYILSLRSKLMKPNIFLKRTPSNIKTNAFSICGTLLWFANTNIQFIIDPYAVASYCRYASLKLTNFVTSLLYSIIRNFHLK
jgi:hypothetical protein